MKKPTESKFDREKIAKIIDDIEKYFKELRSWDINSERLENKQTFYAVSLLIFSIANRYIDLGNEIISAMKLGVPSTYKDIFYILYQNKIINNLTKEAFFRVLECRNAIAHRYHDVTKSEVLDSAETLPVIERFLKRAKDMIG